MPKRKRSDLSSSTNVNTAPRGTGQHEQPLGAEKLSIPYQEKVVDALICQPAPGCPHRRQAVILNHGAGGDMYTHQLVYLTQHLVTAGFTVLRFTCKGLNIVHRIKVYRTVLKYLHSKAKDYEIEKCILAGRSMGSRAAVNVANLIQKEDPDLKDFICGVCCLAYPLHPPKQTNKLRDEPLLALTTPVLFVSGTKDEMAVEEIFQTVLDKIQAPCKVHWLEGVRHSQDTTAEGEQAIGDAITAWLYTL